MDQPERPPETWLDLASRQSLIPVDKHPVPHLSPWGFVHYGQSRKSPPYVSTNVVLGSRYASTELEVLAHLATPPDVRAKSGFDNVNFDGYVITPGHEAVIRLLSLNPLERRMHYRAYLEQELDAAEPDSQREHGLQLERRVWRALDIREMNDKLDRGLEWPLMQTLRSPHQHWFWMLPLVRGHATPTTPSWRGMKHVPVHRLLWSMVSPTKPFISNPQRDDLQCVEPMCVSPWHFYDPADRPVQRFEGPGRGYEADYSTGTRIKWTIEDVVVQPDGTRGIKCPDCGEWTRDRHALTIVNDPAGPPPKGSQMYCWNCYQIWRRKTRGLGPRQPRLPDRHRGQTKTEREEQAFLDAQKQQERESRGLRFQWDNDWSDGTSTRDPR